MKKKIRVVTIKDDEKLQFETNAIYNEELTEIKYVENDEFKTIVKFNFRTNKFTRTNNKYKLEYQFNKNEPTTGIIKVNGISKIVEVIIKTNDIVKNSGNLKIQFCVEDQPIQYIIEVL